MPIAPNRILYEDEQLLVVSKLARELVVKGKGEVGKLPLLDFLKKTYPTLRPVNRLDFETSGIVVFAKGPAVLEKILSQDFEGWEKMYQAIVVGGLSGKGDIDRPLPSRMSGEKVSAHTHYRVIKAYKGATHIEATITTGRHHQIRRHMQMIGHPLVFDDVYGEQKLNRAFAKKLRFRDFFLHASRLQFPHPVTKEVMTIEAPLPRAFEECLNKLKQQ